MQHYNEGDRVRLTNDDPRGIEAGSEGTVTQNIGRAPNELIAALMGMGVDDEGLWVQFDNVSNPAAYDGVPRGSYSVASNEVEPVAVEVAA